MTTLRRELARIEQSTDLMQLRAIMLDVTCEAQEFARLLGRLADVPLPVAK